MTLQIIWGGFIILLASGAWILIQRVINNIWKPLNSAPQVQVLGQYAPLLTWLKYRHFATLKFQAEGWKKVRIKLITCAELVIIIVCALWVGRNYLILDSDRWLYEDWTLNVQSYFNWGLLGKCGACVLWNGSFNGGAPLFIDLIASMAHPIVILLVLLFGAINGSKLIAVAGLIMAGLAQWWWAKEMRLGAIPRLWSALLAIVGGHIIGRMQAGLSEMVFSVASVVLVIPPALRLVRTGERRMAILTGVFLGLAILSGQGYMQLALLLGIVPVFLILLINEHFRFLPVWNKFALAGFIAILIASALLVPVLHDSGRMVKEGNTPDYSGTQPFEYQPLNLVIRDYTYYSSDSLLKLPWPSQTNNFIGWTPILLMLLAFRFIPHSKVRLLVFYLASIGFIYLLSSASVFKTLYLLVPEPLKPLTTLARFPSLFASLAVPFILIIAAWGLDLCMQITSWPTLTLHLTSNTVIVLSLVWLLVIPLGYSVKSTYDFGKPWMDTYSFSTEIDGYEEIILQLKLSTVQWIEPSLGDRGFNIVALENGIKLTNTLHNWGVKDKTAPLPYIRISRDVGDFSNPNFIGTIDFVSVFSYPENLYAFVDTGTRQIPCQATSLGGDIDIDCQTNVAGQLIVHENSWSGWNVQIDGIRAKLGTGQWLTTEALAGKHHYEFRFRPWDVSLGWMLFLLGIGFSVWFWFYPTKKTAVLEIVDEQPEK